MPPGLKVVLIFFAFVWKTRAITTLIVTPTPNAVPPSYVNPGETITQHYYQITIEQVHAYRGVADFDEITIVADNTATVYSGTGVVTCSANLLTVGSVSHLTFEITDSSTFKIRPTDASTDIAAGDYQLICTQNLAVGTTAGVAVTFSASSNVGGETQILNQAGWTPENGIYGSSVAHLPSPLIRTGEAVLSVTFTMTISQTVQATLNDYLQITSNHDIWSSIGADPQCTMTEDGAPYGGTAVFSVFSLSVLRVAPDVSNTFNFGGPSTLVITCIGNLAVGTTTNVAITFDFESTVAGENDDMGVTGWTPAAVVVGADPMTFYGGKKIKFWLPLHKWTALLETTELQVFAHPLAGPEQDLQWIDRFVFFLADGSKFAEVGLARNGFRVNATKLDITLGNGARPAATGKDQALWLEAPQGMVEIYYYKRKRLVSEDWLSSAMLEVVHIQTPSISFMIYASHAGNEFPDDPRMQAKYAHLDWMIIDAPKMQSYKGTLPELWGIQPMSEEVEDMLVPPSEKRCFTLGSCPVVW